jgi:N-acetylmuramoyl-L-alanine amidase
VETFFLSLEASDNEARETAAFENDVIRFEGAADEEPTEDLKAILWDLTQTAAHHESARLAETIQHHLAFVAKGDNRGIKQAPFIVLFGATMPAVLVEIGFISNPSEEKTLSGVTFQKDIATAISKGVEDFDEIHGNDADLASASAAKGKNEKN